MARKTKPMAAKGTQHESRITTDHDEIRRWAEERGGAPACVKGTEAGDTCLLRINFPGYAEESLQDISWEKFFDTFEQSNLAFLFQDKTADGETSRFFKLVDRSEMEPSGRGRHGR